jgi:Tfp pilus assembly protein PilN
MKDIDLLPEWYTRGKRKQQNLRSQYMVLAGVVAIMVVWNLISANSLSSARAQLESGGARLEKSQAFIDAAAQLTAQIDKLNQKTKLLEQIDSRVNIANVISELSFLVDGKIVLSNVILEAGSFEQKQKSGGIRVAGSAANNNSEEHFGQVRFTVVIRGIADQTADVGKFVRRLEESDYFSDVSLEFSRNKIIKSASAGGEAREVSEFEINCNLANYRMQ